MPVLRLTLRYGPKTLRAVMRLGFPRPPARRSVLLVVAAASLLTLLPVARAAIPFNSATVTKVENIVNFGERRGDRSATRRAVAQDIVRANNFLLSETDSRAELQYPDGSLVRIGQNTVFTFDASSRTLALEKGTLIFHIPKGSGGGTIKTPSLTAAITGTTGKVSENHIAILEGEVTLVPSGRKVPANFFARRNPDGTITIGRFNPAQAFEGKLMAFNGPMPGVDDRFALPSLTLPPPADLREWEVLSRTQNQPNSIKTFFPEPNDPPKMREEKTKVVVPKPVQRPPVTPGPRGNGGGKY